MNDIKPIIKEYLLQPKIIFSYIKAKSYVVNPSHETILVITVKYPCCINHYRIPLKKLFNIRKYFFEPVSIKKFIHLIKNNNHVELGTTNTRYYNKLIINNNHLIYEYNYDNDPFGNSTILDIPFTDKLKQQLIDVLEKANN